METPQALLVWPFQTRCFLFCLQILPQEQQRLTFYSGCSQTKITVLPSSLITLCGLDRGSFIPYPSLPGAKWPKPSRLFFIFLPPVRGRELVRQECLWVGQQCCFGLGKQVRRRSPFLSPRAMCQVLFPSRPRLAYLQVSLRDSTVGPCFTVSFVVCYQNVLAVRSLSLQSNTTSLAGIRSCW